jgi:hypothetical protein
MRPCAAQIIADCRLPIADCRLPIADCRLPIADCRLPIADCRLPIAFATLRTGKDCRLVRRPRVAEALAQALLQALKLWQPKNVGELPIAGLLPNKQD